MTLDELQIVYLVGCCIALVVIPVGIAHFLGVHSSRKEDDADQIAYLDKYSDVKRLQKQAKALK